MYFAYNELIVNLQLRLALNTCTMSSIKIMTFFSCSSGWSSLHSERLVTAHVH